MMGPGTWLWHEEARWVLENEQPTPETRHLRNLLAQAVRDRRSSLVLPDAFAAARLSERGFIVSWLRARRSKSAPRWAKRIEAGEYRG